MEKKYKLKTDIHKNLKLPYEEHLNDQQLRAVTSGDGPKLIIAGAGSGKTRTITYRVAYLLEHGISPQHILLLTFTNKAAREMLGRVEQLTGVNLKGFWGGTFHSVASRILRRECHRLGYTRSYTILDKEDAADLMDTSIEESGKKSLKKLFPNGRILVDIISFHRNTSCPIKDALMIKAPQFQDYLDVLCDLMEAYTQRKKKNDSMDYDDLLINFQQILEDASVRDEYSAKFRHILVDEYQDTNLLQRNIVEMLAQKDGNLMVVGDDCQAIFAFRGANYRNIFEFTKRYPNAEVFKLEYNYRSTPQIIDLTNDSIVHNRSFIKKTLIPVVESGCLPVFAASVDVRQQARFVAQRILELIEQGRNLDEIGVLYRSHYHSLEVQFELTRRNIPYRIRSGLRFFEQAHVKDVLAFLKIIHNQWDEVSWRRILKMLPGVGTKTASKIWTALLQSDEPVGMLESGKIFDLVPPRAKADWSAFAQELKNLKIAAASEQLESSSGHSVNDILIDMVLKGKYESYMKKQYENYEARLEDLNQLMIFSTQFTTLEGFLSELSLTDTIAGEEVVMGGSTMESVTLSSVHQAKGLEWEVVFIIWLAEGRFPATKSLNADDGEEEERRLFYVAATRAKQELYLAYPTWAQNYGYRELMLRPSRFITELSPSLYEVWHMEEEYFDA